MKIISRATLRKFWEREEGKEARQPLLAWFREAEKANWKSPADIKALYRSASFVGDERVIFNIAGNKFRLIVWVKYSLELVLIKFVGTHAEYDNVDAAKVGLARKKEKR